MLGGLAVAQGDRRISRFQTQKTGALLAFLALNPGKNHGRETLAEMLWPEGDPLAIRNRLNQAISSLRRQLHPPELGPGTVLVTDHHSVGVNAQTVTTDVDEFERSVRQAEKAATDEERIRILESAVAMYRGELLEGYYEDWIFSRRMHLADLYDKALQQIIRSYVAVGKPDAALEFARLRLAIDPYDEAPHVILMRLYMRSGRPKSALKQYEDLVRALQSFDDEPSEVAEKYRQRAEAMLEDRAASQDFDEEFSEVPAKRHVEALSPVREEIASNLPRVVSSFVGREAEMQAISDQLRSRRSRLVTILGLGGCGKSRLAIEVGWSLHEACDAKVFFVPLAGLREPSALIGEIVRVLLPGKTALADPLNSVIAQLKRTPCCLLILDSFEHMADAGGGTLLSELLEKAPSLALLVTSRVPLNVHEEQQVHLAPLPLPPEEGDELKELASNPSVSLFVDRAQLVKSDFQLTERTSGAIIRLIRKLEGMPLALELAASWARVLTPTQMLDQVDSNVGRLESRRRDVSPRHRSLRAAFDGTFELLDETLRNAFLRLTCFAGGWDYESASHLCPEGDVVSLMQALEERSLINVQPSDDTVRFGMLDTIRSFGKSLMDVDDRRKIGLEHAAYFLALAERQSPGYEWVPEIEQDYPNCVAALHRFQDAGDKQNQARMAIALTRFWDARGMHAEGRECLRQIIDEFELDDLTQARIQASIGRLDWIAGDFDSSVSRMNSALATFVSENAVPDRIAANFVLQLEAHRKGDYEAARRLLRENLELSKSIGDLAAESRCWLALGNAATEEEKFDAAQEKYGQSLESGRKANDHEMIGAALTNLANLAVYRGQIESAEKWISESIAQFDKSRWKWYRAMNLVVKGRIEIESGNHKEAARSLINAYRIASTERLVVWRFVMQFSQVLFNLGYIKDAARFAGYLERFRDRIGERYHGIEMRRYEERLAAYRSQMGEAAFSEQSEIGRNMTEEEIESTVLKVHRAILSEV